MIRNLIEIIWDKLRGLKYDKKTVLEVELNSKTSIEKIQSIIAELDFRTILNFYDAYYDLDQYQKPTPLGDSGAFTEVVKEGKDFKVRLGNHGGFKNNGKWTIMSEEKLISTIYNSREYNGGKMTIESKVAKKQWRKTEKGKTLYAFYHDISDKSDIK